MGWKSPLGDTEQKDVRGGGAEAEAAGATGDDGNLALEGEERGEVVELDVCHGCRLGEQHWSKAEERGLVDGRDASSRFSKRKPVF